MDEDKDKEKPEGEKPPETPPADKGKEPETPPGDKSGGTGDEKKPEETTLPKTVEELNALIKKSVDAAAVHIRADESKKTKTQLQKEADEKALKDKADWEALSKLKEGELETATGTIKSLKDDLKTMKAELEAHQTALKVYLDKEIEGVDKTILDLLKDKPVVDQLKWLAENKANITTGQRQSLGQTGTGAGNNGAKLTAEQQKVLSEQAFDQGKRSF